MDREKSAHIDQLEAEDLGDAISMRTDRGKLEYRYGKAKARVPKNLSTNQRRGRRRVQRNGRIQYARKGMQQEANK